MESRKTLLPIILIFIIFISGLLIFIYINPNAQAEGTQTTLLSSIFEPEVTRIPSLTPTATITQTPTISPTQQQNEIVTLNCIDCFLAPVDKKTKLQSTYTPQVAATGLSGGGFVTQNTKTALVELFNLAASQNIDITIISSYRSYQEQQNTFEYWVQTEIAKGYSRAEAEVIANTYSARPGHSEHQLGTTVDVKCSMCASFDNSPGNTILYDFLQQNAHTFGFVISYPKNKQSLTGYTYEPWHIRYVGVENATALYNLNYLQSNNIYLAQFLRDLN